MDFKAITHQNAPVETDKTYLNHTKVETNNINYPNENLSNCDAFHPTPNQTNTGISGKMLRSQGLNRVVPTDINAVNPRVPFASPFVEEDDDDTQVPPLLVRPTQLRLESSIWISDDIKEQIADLDDTVDFFNQIVQEKQDLSMLESEMDELIESIKLDIEKDAMGFEELRSSFTSDVSNM